MNQAKRSTHLRLGLAAAGSMLLAACGGGTDVTVIGPTNSVFEAGTPTAVASNVRTDAALNLTVVDLRTAEVTVMP